MKYSFNRKEVERLIAITDAASKCQVTYTGKSWKHIKARKEDDSLGLALVGDEGVYLMSNNVGQARDPDGRVPHAYAIECDPSLPFALWWDAKGQGFGSSDGTEFIPLRFAKMWLANSRGRTLTIKMDERRWSLEPGPVFVVDRVRWWE